MARREALLRLHKSLMARRDELRKRLGGGMRQVGILAAAGAWALARARRSVGGVPVDRSGRESWRMPPLAMLSKPVMSRSRKVGLTVLRSYLAIAMVLVVVRLVQVALGQ